MDLNTLLQANRSASAAAAAAGYRTMQYEVPLPLSMNHDMNSAPHYANNSLYVPGTANSRVKSETGSERAVSPHSSEHSSRYSSQTPYQHIANQLSQLRYPSPSGLGQPNGLGLMQQYNTSTSTPDQIYQSSSLGVQHTLPPEPGSLDISRGSNGLGGGPAKAFACSTCQKPFARRSDLARHERIHSGVRPHVCEHPGCGKQFIQRSALTVHTRVHTGEKPHMCERCGKPFSDSSSLARHRRIHSGKRPYKCPYVNCQKTFTRRTTLTRHQNSHTGTIEESEAATAAALASRIHLLTGRPRRNGNGSDDENDFSGDGKSDRSVSPGAEAAANEARVVEYMNALNGIVPAHMRPEMQPPHSASSAHHSRTQSPNSAHGYQVPGVSANGGAQRPGGLTSNPSSSSAHTYAILPPPPQIMEPPTTNGQSHQHQQGPASTNGSNSPHHSNNSNGGTTLGWQSPHASSLNGHHHQRSQGHAHSASAGGASAADFSYPDPNNSYQVNPNPVYYQQQQQQQGQVHSRPHSTTPASAGASAALPTAPPPLPTISGPGGQHGGGAAGQGGAGTAGGVMDFHLRDLRGEGIWAQHQQ